MFREDLFYRLDVLPLSWPSLRERRDDILPLANYFIAKHACRPGFQLTADAARLLLNHDWPGNVRELENVIQRALILARGLHLQPADLMLPQVEARMAPWWMSVCHWAKGWPPVVARPNSSMCAGYAASLRWLTAPVLPKPSVRLPVHCAIKLAAMREQGIDIDQMIRA